MGKQSQAFLDGEGAAWVARNKNTPKPDPDPVIKAIEDIGIRPISVLEVGHGDNWRLLQLEDKYNCFIHGIDPAVPAPNRGTADNLHFPTDEFDLLIYGFCLYLCDPEDYIRIAMEGDRVLMDGGYMVIHDFYSMEPYKTPYKHKNGLFSHHMDFRQMWAWHPYYSCIGNYAVPDRHESVAVLKKDIKQGFPVRP
jgi:hypothetical protein